MNTPISVIVHQPEQIAAAEDRSPIMEAVLSDIAIGVSILDNAEGAHSAGEFGTAERSHLEVERRFATILRSICKLTDAEVDCVEPLLTEFEERLIGLRRGLLNQIL